MAMLQVFHMNKGEGESSYAKNCSTQNKILSMTKPFVEEAMQSYFETGFPETLAMADLGCSSGSTALATVWGIIDVIDARCRLLGHRDWPNIMVYLNDLPGNDFNKVFASLSSFHKRLKEEKGADFGPCFTVGLPGNFYGRLLPSQTLHFVHSSSSLHWLSQVPPCLNDKVNPEMMNKGKIYVSMTSPRCVVNAYMLQFRNDFIAFLRCRSEEVISGGRMVLTFMGRKSIDPTFDEGCHPWDLIAHSLMTMVSEGLIEEEKVDLFNVPFYAPCHQELMQLIEEEASFSIIRFEAFELEWDGGDQRKQLDDGNNYSLTTRGERIANMHRAVVESMFQHHFGSQIMDDFFRRYSQIVDDHIFNHRPKIINLVISLIRN